MRVVFDTNVLISALLWPKGNPAQAVTFARQGRVHSITSPALLDEFRGVLREKFDFQVDPLEVAVELMASFSEIVTPRRSLRAVPADPDDNRVLECAVEGRADAIVTGDGHLLALKSFHGIGIISPRSSSPGSAGKPAAS